MNGQNPEAQTWRDQAGRIVLDLGDPRGQPIETPADRRWLWRIASQLTVTGISGELWQLAGDLHGYLAETCEHHWLSYDSDEYLPAHRQCLWCKKITAPAEPGTTEEPAQ
jgi:hypothetical protein